MEALLARLDDPAIEGGLFHDIGIVAPEDMLSELQADNRELARNLRSVHELCDEHNDVATASLIENWIDGTQRRAWAPVRSSWHVRPERDERC
jgi:hypothetical protein